MASLTGSVGAIRQISQRVGLTQPTLMSLSVELRQLIYQFCLGIVVLWVNGPLDLVLRTLRGSLTNLSDSWFNIADGQWVGMPSSLFLVSKQIFEEMRTFLHHRTVYFFARRWDFISAHARSSVCNPQQIFLPPTSGWRLYPPTFNPFVCMQHLYLDFKTVSDFDNVVSTDEARRVTTTILQVIRHNLPALRHLAIDCNERSKVVANGEFIPHPWFIRNLMFIRPLVTFVLNHYRTTQAPGYRHNLQQASRYFSTVMSDHFEAVRMSRHLPSGHLDPTLANNRLVRDIGRRMTRLMMIDGKADLARQVRNEYLQL